MTALARAFGDARARAESAPQVDARLDDKIAVALRGRRPFRHRPENAVSGPNTRSDGPTPAQGSQRPGEPRFRNAPTPYRPPGPSVEGKVAWEAVIAVPCDVHEKPANVPCTALPRSLCADRRTVALGES